MIPWRRGGRQPGSPRGSTCLSRSMPAPWWSSSSLHCLCVKVEEAGVRIVDLLRGLIGLAAVEFVELFSVVVGVGVQRFVPVQRTDLLLDQSIRRATGRAHRNRRPEADVDVAVSRPDRIQCPAVIVTQPQRAQPDRSNRYRLEEPFQELRRAFEWELDILDHPFAGRTAIALFDVVGDTEPPVECYQLPVHAAAAVASRPPASQAGVLCAESTGAPEPVGVPSPEVVVHCQTVFCGAGVVLDGAVVDALSGVVTGRAGSRGAHTER